MEVTRGDPKRHAFYDTPNRLASEHFLDFADFLLDLTFDLFGFACSLQSIVSDRLACGFLDAACDGFGGACDLVLRA